MPRRLDALGARPERAVLFRGGMLEHREDEGLQALVAKAAEDLGAPIALVSLVLERVQLFRAQIGLPPDLAIARATDRDVSFCQFVVRDEAPLEVNDASDDARVPQDLVARYGIQAYLGVPLRVRGGVVGSLCVLDTRARSFSVEQVARLEKLAVDAARRLEELADEDSGYPTVTAAASQPAFGELRNVLQGLHLNLSLARVAAAELGPLARLATRWVEGSPPLALGALVSAGTAVEGIEHNVRQAEEAAEQLAREIASLQDLLTPATGPHGLARILEVADQVAHHMTKLVGGVAWGAVPDDGSIRGSRSVAIATVSTCLSALASAANAGKDRRGLTVTTRRDGPDWDVCIEGPLLDEDSRRRVLDELGDLVGADPKITATLDETGIHIRLTGG